MRINGEGIANDIEGALSETMELSRRAHAWNLFGVESHPGDQAAREVLPVARELLESTRELLGAFAACDDSTGDLATRCGDVAFFALQEMNQIGASIETTATQGHAGQLVEQCDRMRGRIMTACSALHDALCQRGEQDPRDDVRRAEIDQGLRVRAKYTQFRQALARAASATSDDLYRRMRLVGTQVAMLVGSKTFQEIRVGDRMILRDIQAQVLGWLGSSDKDPVSAARIWSDVDSFAKLSREINRRADLQEHDCETFGRLWAHLATLQADDVIAVETVPWVEQLRGCNVELDELLDGDVPQPLSAWRHGLQTAYGNAPDPGELNVAPPVPSPPTSIETIAYQVA